MLSKTCCSESVVLRVIWFPSTVNVPAVTGVAKPAVPTVIALKLPSGLRDWLMFEVPVIRAAVANWEILNA